MNLYKHLLIIHLKSTTSKQSVLSSVYSFGVDICMFWCCGGTQSVNLIKLHHDHGNCDGSAMLLKRGCSWHRKGVTLWNY